jgi:chaperonin cofactor prefoldin
MGGFMPRSLSLAILLILLAADSTAAQSPDTSSPPPVSQSQDAAPSSDAKKPKKVWTNENLSDANGAVSVVGDSKSKPKLASSKLTDAQYIATTRKQLEKLQSQIADADKQITDLTNFSKGEPSTSAGGIKLNKGYNREPIEVQIRTLQEKKKDLQAQIDALLDEARKKGVEPGQLR